MKKILILPVFIFLIHHQLFATNSDEGMWLPIYLKSLNENNMKSLGMKLTTDDIYSINHSSLKDAVVMLNNGTCTGEIVSDHGLMLTNHHCGYDYITKQSTVGKNYLRDGFWAKSNDEELPNPGLSVSILQYMNEVTQKMDSMMSALPLGFSQEEKIKTAEEKIIQDLEQGDGYRAEIKSFYNDNKYYLVLYQVFKDVRLVGTPPSSIGKFGGNTDNWTYPRQTGDFSVFRIYMAPDGSPAEYSKGNIPYKPKKYLQISLKGFKKGDFSMVLGFPGNTQRYITSYEVKMARDYVNPVIIDAYDTQIRAMQKIMDKDSVVKLAIASDFAQDNNTYKYYVGQESQLKSSNLIEVKTAYENTLKSINDSGKQQSALFNKYLEEIQNTTTLLSQMQPALGYYHYGLFQSQLVGYALNFYPFINFTKESLKMVPQTTQDSIKTLLQIITSNYLQKSTLSLDKAVLSNILYRMFTMIPKDKQPQWLTSIYHNGGDTALAFDNYIAELSASSSLLNLKKSEKFYKKFNFEKLKKDPMMVFFKGVIQYYLDNFAGYEMLASTLDNAQHKYMGELLKLENSPVKYPDANSTLRISYGSVLPYEPKDGILYKYYTTYEGILEKNKIPNPEYEITPAMYKLLENKKFGRYAENDTLRVNFITNNDITGGNSGSPVVDANGNLIGIAFDGDWESMISDLKFNPSTNRTICVDIRYVLWVMDIYAGAGHLVKEMKVIEK